MIVAALHGATDDGEGREVGAGASAGERSSFGGGGGGEWDEWEDSSRVTLGTPHLRQSVARRAVTLVALVAPPRLGLGLILGLVVVDGGRGGVDRFSRGPTEAA